MYSKWYNLDVVIRYYTMVKRTPSHLKNRDAV